MTVKEFYAKDRNHWRRWLEKNHAKAERVRLILFKKGASKSSVSYADAVEEALCFGWIDSKPSKRDNESYLLLFTERKPRSVWSKINKGRILELVKEGKMTDAGLAKIERAKMDGSWEALDQIEELIMPPVLQKALMANRVAAINFDKFPAGVKKGIYQWIISAKTEPTLLKRVKETIEKAAENIRANQWKPPTK
jgi:uncharacterized protein YdeI (YjbR/CyaY-like superfamily)